MSATPEDLKRKRLRYLQLKKKQAMSAAPEAKQAVAVPEKAEPTQAEDIRTKDKSVLTGMASLITGPFQLGANIGDYLNEKIDPLEDMGEPVRLTPGAQQGLKEAGMEVPEPYERLKVGKRVNEAMREWGKDNKLGYELAGMALNPMNLMKTGVTKAPQLTEAGQQVAKTLGQRMGEGAKVGAMYGTAMPVTGENYKHSKSAQIGAGLLFPPLLSAGGLGISKAGQYVDKVTRPLPFRNTPGNLFDKIQKAPGMVMDVAEKAKGMAGGKFDDVVTALTQKKPGETSTQALARYSRENVSAVGPKKPEVVGSKLIKMGTEIGKKAPDDEAVNLYAGQERGRAEAVDRIAKTQIEREADLARRAANAQKGYSPEVMSAKVDPRSGAQMLETNAAKAQQKALEAEMSKAAALKDWGRFKTLEAQLKELSLGKPPIQNVPGKSQMRTQSVREGMASPETPNMWSPPRYKGEVRAPSRYAPQMPRSQEAGIAAQEVKAIAAQRLQEQQMHSGISESMLLNRAGETGQSFGAFATKPSIIKGIEAARQSALEKGTYFPSKPGDQFSIGNLQRIKRSIADDVSIPAGQEGSLAKTVRSEQTDTVQSFTDWLRSKSPAFAKADDRFSADSAAVNQSKAGVILKEGLTQNEKETPLRYLRATDNPKNAEAFKALTPEQQGVREDVKQAMLDKLKIKNVSQQVEPQLSQLKGLTPEIANPLYRPIMILKSALKNVSRDKLEKYHRIVWNMEKDPDYMVKLLRLPDSDPAKKWVLDTLTKGEAMGQAYSIGATN